MVVKKGIFILYLFTLSFVLSVNAYSQKSANLKIDCEDSVYFNRKKQDVIKLALTLTNTDNLSDSIVIEGFNRIVGANLFYTDDPHCYNDKCLLPFLFFELRELNGDLILPMLIMIDPVRLQNWFWVLDTVKLKYKKSKYPRDVFPGKDLYFKHYAGLSVYLDIDKYYYLNKGRYYAYVYYCNTNERATEYDTHRFFNKYKFVGSFSSDKILVIVE